MARGRRKAKGRNRTGRTGMRRLALRAGLVLLTVLAVWALAAEWFVHHPREWLRDHDSALARPLLWLGNPLADVTDALDWTGEDTVYEYDLDPPADAVLFAGAPRRTGLPAPADITVLDRGEFLIGWSPSLHHPVWCAYHVKREATFDQGRRPSFTLDREVPSAPSSSAYEKTGYDRGHLVPNYAIATRYGPEMQRRTFLTTNIAPQTPALNRGVWREVEHRIADLWTARYGEIWVVVGCVPGTSGETLNGSAVKVPESFFQLIVAQDGPDVRALALLFDQTVAWDAWAARHIVSVDELERETGLDFFPDLPNFIQDPLEAGLPSRLWPIRPGDIFRQIMLRFPD